MIGIRTWYIDIQALKDQPYTKLSMAIAIFIRHIKMEFDLLYIYYNGVSFSNL